MTMLPNHFLSAVVSIGTLQVIDKNKREFKSLATGFMAGKCIDSRSKRYRLFLITNRHVFQNERDGVCLREVYFRFNTLEGSSHFFYVKLLKEDGKPIWYTHNDIKVDLAVLPISAQDITKAKIDYYFFKDDDLINAKDFKENNISTGDDLFVLGFPIGISGNTRNFVIVRKGIISRVDEELLNEGFFYIDTNAYPGNSGGPVIIKPELFSLEGTKAHNSSNLIGVISSGETYNDIAISQQTGEAKIVFTEQIGLIRVVPTEKIMDIINNIFGAQIDEAKVKITKKEIIEEESNKNYSS